MSFSINVIPILCTKDSRLGVFVAFSHFLFAISAFICLYALVFVDMWICVCMAAGVLVRFTHELLLTGQDFAALQDA